MGWNWNPISWADDAWHAISGTATDVERWVVKVVKDAATLVEHDVLAVFSVADRAYQDALQFASQQATSAVSLAYQVGDAAYAAIDQVAQEATGLAEGLFTRAEQGVTWVFHEAEGLVAGAEQMARGELDAVVRDLVDPVVHFVAGADRWVAHHLDDFWHVVYRDVIHPIEHDLDVARHDVATAGRWIAHEGEYAYHLVAKAADWLEWLGLHAIHEVEAIPGEVAGLLSFRSLEAWLKREEAGLGDDLKALAGEVFR